MKNVLFILVFACCLFSCAKEEELLVEAEQFSLDQYPQKWQLVSMGGSVANIPPLTGDQMTWQEYYLLHANGTFTKHRQQHGQATAASGTFSFKKLGSDDFMNLVLTYGAKLPIIGTCSSEPEEYMALLSSDSMRNSWNSCDGPSLQYKRVKYEAADGVNK